MTNNGKLNKKTKHSNNLTVSLGRMTYIKAKTLTWMKGFDKLSTYNMAVSGCFTTHRAYTIYRKFLYQK